MSRPTVTIGNRLRVYEHYRDYEPNQRMARIGHALMGVAYRPHVTYGAGVEAGIVERLHSGGQLLLASNHRNIHDQCNVAAMARQEVSLRQLRGTTNIPTKAGLSRNGILRRAIDTMGSIPVFRAKDIRKDYREVPFSEEEATALAEAGQLLIDTGIHKINSGRHLYMFPEGTRGDDDTQLGTLRRGIGEIACGVNDSVDLTIVPIGLYYGGHNFRPNMHIAEPIDGPFADPMAVVTNLEVAMQGALEGAILQSQLRAA